MGQKHSDKVRETLARAKKERKSTQKILKEMHGIRPEILDRNFLAAHEKVFARTDCLECANCCKTSSPIITNKDIDRMAAHLRMKPGDFVVKYLRIDEDEDYVIQQTPCVFLNDDDTCSIYEHRPKACREYPHTDRKNMREILELTYKNSLVCPAVYEIIREVESLIARK